MSYSMLLLLNYFQRKRSVTFNELTTEKRNDLMKRCRVCLKKGTVPIYGDETARKKYLSLYISSFGNIEINKYDNLPKRLCPTCYDILKKAVWFRKTARQTDQKLKKIITSQIVPSPSSTNNINYHTTARLCENADEISMYEKEIDSDDIEKFSCELCNKSFYSIDDVNYHKYSVHNIDNETSKDKEIEELNNLPVDVNNRVQCPVCHKSYEKTYYIKLHVPIHDATKRAYICEVCGKTFIQRASFDRHALIHTDDLPFKCQICPYRGRDAYYLKNHMKQHNKEFRYLCSQCPARFKTKSNFNRHYMSHKGIKKFKCDTCQKAFFTKPTLESHIQAVHLGLKNYECNICKQTFSYRKNLTTHRIRIHKVKKEKGGNAVYLKQKK